MILTSSNNIRAFVILGLWALLCVPFSVAAQSNTAGVSIVVAPTLIELATEPGEVWRSNVKVVNTNTFPLTVYTEPAHFAPTGELGQGSTVPLDAIPDGEAVLATWVTIDSPTITIPAGSSVNVPFTVTAPEDAPPGSHFAALQVSTVPSNTEAAIGVSTAQVISSLLFVRVAGDIEEVGTVRSFTSTNSYSTVPRSDFRLRFENTGNVHLRPVGEIIIRNMWGSERGRIPVNVNTSFGNALPETIRTYDFSWQREPSLFDVGFYSAEVTLAYGYEAKQFTSADTRFWVIPIKPILLTLAIVGGIIGLIILISRWYIKRLLAQAGVTSLQSLHAKPRQSASKRAEDLVVANTTPSQTTSKLQTYLDRSQQGLGWLHKKALTLWNSAQTIWSMMSVRAHYVVIVIVAGLFALLILFWWWHSQQSSVGYQATIGADTQAVTYNAEEIALYRLPDMSPSVLTADDSDWYIDIVNASQNEGAAGELAATLVHDFPVRSVETASEVRKQTVIIFPQARQREALALAEQIPGALLSATDTATDIVTIYIGTQ